MHGLWLAGLNPESVMNTRQPASQLFTDAPQRAGLAPQAPLPDAPALQRLFISGHSLVDQPFPDQMEALAARAGNPLRWERLHLFGSSIRQRTLAPLADGPQDALLITEQHTLLGNLMWNDTPRHLRQWADALHAGNPHAVTYFYVPWLSIDDRNDPSRWIAYEKAAAHVWQCMVTRVNVQLADEGRRDRIVTIPASLALVDLIAHLAAGAVLPGASAATPREAIDRVMADEVHLTPLGSFYMALVSYLGMTGLPPRGIDPDLLAEPLVPEVSPEQARWLLHAATAFFASHATKRGIALDSDGCRRYLEESFIDDYWRYVRIAQLAPQMGFLRSSWSACAGGSSSGTSCAIGKDVMPITVREPCKTSRHHVV
ncbi:MAG: hypothetical protein QM696_09925 [Steroidobacteraceae bacterium]